MSRYDFEQRVYVAKISAGGSLGDAARAAAVAREWWELTYRKPKRIGPPLAPVEAKP